MTASFFTRLNKHTYIIQASSTVYSEIIIVMILFNLGKKLMKQLKRFFTSTMLSKKKKSVPTYWYQRDKSCVIIFNLFGSLPIHAIEKIMRFPFNNVIRLNGKKVNYGCKICNVWFVSSIKKTFWFLLAVKFWNNCHL